MVINGNKAIVKHLIDAASKQFIVSGASLPSGLKTCKNIYRKNGYYDKLNVNGVYCYAIAYDYWYKDFGSSQIIGNGVNSFISIVSKNQFNTNSKCQILRDTYGTYYKYLDSLAIKYPCGNGLVSEIPSGKENTYILANSGVSPAATWVASINVDAPNLVAGNWWIPSVAELVQMTYDITWFTSFYWQYPDIINEVLVKLRKQHYPISYNYPCTSSIYDSTSIFSSYKTISWWGDNNRGSG